MKRKALIMLLSIVLLCALAACSGLESNLINKYESGGEFDFSIWQAQTVTYTCSEKADGGVEVTYAKSGADNAYDAMLAQVEGDLSSFGWLNFTITGNEGKLMMARLGDAALSGCLLGRDKHFELKSGTNTYSYQIDNSSAWMMIDLTEIYLFAEPGAKTAEASGTFTVNRSWMSKTKPNDSQIVISSHKYLFADSGDWESVGGWWNDKSWTNISLQKSESGVRAITQESKPAKKDAPIIRPFSMAKGDNKLTFEFNNINNSITRMKFLLRGARKEYVDDAAGAYWLYHEGTIGTYVNAETGASTHMVALEFNIADARARIGSNLDDDGYMLVVFCESAPDQLGSTTNPDYDGVFDMEILSCSTEVDDTAVPVTWSGNTDVYTVSAVSGGTLVEYTKANAGAYTNIYRLINFHNYPSQTSLTISFTNECARDIYVRINPMSGGSNLLERTSNLIPAGGSVTVTVTGLTAEVDQFMLFIDSNGDVTGTNLAGKLIVGSLSFS